MRASALAAIKTAALAAEAAAVSHDKAVDAARRGTSLAHTVAASLADAAERAEKYAVPAPTPAADDADMKRAIAASLADAHDADGIHDADMKKAIAESLAEMTPAAAAAAVAPTVAQTFGTLVEATPMPTPVAPEPDALSQQANALIEEIEQGKEQDEAEASEDEGFALVAPVDEQADPFPAPGSADGEWDDSLLDDLEEMGFGNRTLNKELLAKHEGDLKKTVRALVEKTA